MGFLIYRELIKSQYRIVKQNKLYPFGALFKALKLQETETSFAEWFAGDNR